MSLDKTSFKTMKIILAFASFLLLSSKSSFAQGNKASVSRIACQSYKKINGWVGYSTYDYVQFNALVESATSIKNASISGAFLSDSRDLNAQPDPENKFLRARFSLLEDAWCWFHFLTPKNFNTQEKEFKSSVQYSCEGGFQYQYIDLSCRIVKE